MAKCMRCGRKHDTEWQECPRCIKNTIPKHSPYMLRMLSEYLEW